MEYAASLPVTPRRPPDLALARAERMQWLVRLRWVALASVLLGALAAPWLGMTGINLPVLLGAVGAGVAFNGYFLWGLQRAPKKVGDPLLHALPDFGALTLVLWASGDVRNPFLSLYFVHVLLVSVLSGKRSGLVACAVALFCAGFLSSIDLFPLLQISSFDPDPVWLPPINALAFVVTLLAAAYVATRASNELALRRREAEAARRASQRDAEILLSALDRLEVGVEILQPDGSPSFRNRHLLQRHGSRTDCPRDSHACESLHGACPVDEARAGKSGSCRFSVHGGDKERVIELLSFPLSDQIPAPVLRLHLDRTESVLAERRLLFAEKLASLGRTVQAVAHELNTPLATIQTLAADMRAALLTAPGEASELAADLDESAALILDEMRRCKEITQGLLGGRDLLSGGSAHGPANLGTALRRAATLVFGTQVSRSRLEFETDLDPLSAGIGHDSLVQVFVNLLQNAADVVEGVPGAGVRVGRLDARSVDTLTLYVDDDGPGLTLGSADRVFEAFYTTKPPGKGTGLGLYTARSLLREAGGELHLETAPSGGVRARLVLPAGVLP